MAANKGRYIHSVGGGAPFSPVKAAQRRFEARLPGCAALLWTEPANMRFMIVALF